jgi:hypothetical protein
MSVGFAVKFCWYQIGSGDFLHSFFSTIAYNLEDGKWGSKFPVFMNELYGGVLKNDHILIAKKELQMISGELKKCSVDKAIWDIDDLSKPMPWGNNISSEITDLSNYFVNSDGADLITLIFHCFDRAVELNSDVVIKSL